jgi:hypothetical protein
MWLVIYKPLGKYTDMVKTDVSVCVPFGGRFGFAYSHMLPSNEREILVLSPG